MALYPLVRPKFFDNNSVLASGYQLFFYEVGTTTKKNTFTDGTFTTANPNPIILNTRGEPDNAGTPIDIYLISSGTYKVVLAPDTDTDPPTSPVWTVDNVTDLEGLAQEWINQTAATRASATTFTISGVDVTATFHTGRRVKLTGGSDVYGSIESSVFATDTTVTVAVDAAGTLNAAMDTAFVGLISADTTSSAINYYPEEAGEIGVINRTYEIGNVLRYGATGLGIVDDLNSIINARLSVEALQRPHTSQLTRLTSKRVFFPDGIYRISGPITSAFTDYIDFIGQKVILALDAGVTAFSFIGLKCTFSGLSFMGGATAIAYDATTNIDTTDVIFRECDFINQTGTIIDKPVGAVTLRAKFYDCLFAVYTASARLLNAEKADSWEFHDCWFEGGIEDHAFMRIDSNTLFVNCYFIPFDIPSTVPAWFDVYGGLLTVRDCRIGGEGAGALTVVRNYLSSDPDGNLSGKGINMQDNIIFCQNSVITFFAIPEVVIFENNKGFVDIPAWEFDSTIPNADLDLIGSNKTVLRFKGNTFPLPKAVDYTKAGYPVKAQFLIPLKTNREPTVSYIIPNISTVVINSQGASGGFGLSIINDDISTSQVADELGVPIYEFEAIADMASTQLAYTTMLDGLSAGVYTAKIAYNAITDHVFELRALASTMDDVLSVGKGRGLLHIPFYFDGTNNQIVRFSVFNMQLGATIGVERFVIYEGNIITDSKRVIVEGTAIPTTGQWYKGDRVVTTAIAVGSPKSWINTVAGSQGTWVSEGNL